MAIATGDNTRESLSSAAAYPLGALGNLTLPTSVQPQFDASYIALFERSQGVVRGSFSSVLEPATIALIGLGLAGLGCSRRKQ
jgi:hypothetical protein